MAKITYENKVALNVNSDIADVNKCNATDLNEIKNVVNENDDNTTTNTNDIANNTAKIGTLSNLNTTNKNNLVSAINEVNNNMHAKIGLTSSVSTTAGDYNKIPYDSIIEIEEGLSLNNNGIKVSKKGKYLVTLIGRLKLTGIVYLAIRKNNIDSNEAVVSCSTDVETYTVSAVVNCQENDTIYGYVYSSNSITLFGGGNPPIWVSMAVTKI